MTTRGTTARASSRLTVAVVVSAGIHAAVFGAVSLVPATTGEPVRNAATDSLHVQLVSAAPASDPVESRPANAAADGAEAVSAEPMNTAASATAPEVKTAPVEAAAPTEQSSRAGRPGRAGRTDTGHEPLRVTATESAPREDSPPIAATSMSRPRTTASDRTPRSSIATATIRTPQPRAPIIPSYPRRAQRLGWEGTTVVRATVETDGSPTALRIIASSGYDLLNRAALEAVRSATFHPGVVGASEKRRMNVDLRIVFQLVDKESS